MKGFRRKRGTAYRRHSGSPRPSEDQGREVPGLLSGRWRAGRVSLPGRLLNDKHIEIIVRQMLKKLSIIDAGDTGFLMGEQVDKLKFLTTNAKCLATASRPPWPSRWCLASPRPPCPRNPSSRRVLPGNDKVADRVRPDRQEDYLYGLKENVIVGRLVNAGYWLPGVHRKRYLRSRSAESPDKSWRILRRIPISWNSKFDLIREFS